MRKMLVHLFAVIFMSIAICPAKSKAENPVHIQVFSGGYSGIYYRAAIMLCHQIMKKYPQVLCEVISSGGSGDNVDTLMQRALQKRNKNAFGFVQHDVLHQAVSANIPISSEVKYNIVFFLHQESLVLMAKKGINIDSLAHLVGKNVHVGNPGSGTATTVEDLLI